MYRITSDYISSAFGITGSVILSAFNNSFWAQVCFGLANPFLLLDAVKSANLPKTLLFCTYELSAIYGALNCRGYVPNLSDLLF
jgi:hypothetical protein